MLLGQDFPLADLWKGCHLGSSYGWVEFTVLLHENEESLSIVSAFLEKILVTMLYKNLQRRLVIEENS